MQIYLLRHGQTEYNAQHRYQGQQDIPLSAAGRAQLRPAGFMPDVAYVSPLIRARQTAEIFFPPFSPSKNLPLPFSYLFNLNNPNRQFL